MLFSFFKILFFWVVRRLEGKRAKNGPKCLKIFCLTPYLRNCTSYDCGFWYTCKIMISSNFFSLFFLFFSLLPRVPPTQTRQLCFGLPALAHYHFARNGIPIKCLVAVLSGNNWDLN